MTELVLPAILATAGTLLSLGLRHRTWEVRASLVPVRTDMPRNGLPPAQ